MKLETLLERLEGVHQLNDHEWMAICPTHDDVKPSLAVTTSIKHPGEAVTHCFAGCKSSDVLAALQGPVRIHQRNGHATRKIALKRSSKAISEREDRSPLEWLRDYTGLGEAFLKQQDIIFNRKGSIGYRFEGMDTVKWRDYDRAGKGRWDSNGEGQPPLWPALPDKISDVVFLAAGETDSLCLRAALEGTGVDAFALTKGEGYVPAGALKELRKRGCLELVYVPDLDAAGQRGAGKLQTAAERIGLKWTAISLEEHLDGAAGEKDVRDLTRRIGIDALLEILQTAYEQGPKPLALTAATYAEQAPAHIDWLCEPWLAIGTTTLISGFAKAGKTTFLFKLMHEMEKGGQLLGREVKPAAVLVWTENSAIAWRYKCDKFLNGFPSHVFVVPRDAEDLIGRGFEENARAIFREARERDCKLVVMDSLAGLAGFEDSNDQAKVSAALIPINRLCRRYGLAACMIHHLNKAGSSPAGSFVFTAEPDTLLEMRGEYNEPRSIKVRGRLLMEAPPELTFKMNPEGEYETVIETGSGTLEALPNRESEAITLRELAERMEMEFDDRTRMSLKRTLDQMIEEGSARSISEGGRGKVHKYYAVTLKPTLRRVK